MEVPREILYLKSILDKCPIWVGIVLFLVIMYLLVAFFTWSFKKPLKYLGIPTIIVGFLFIIMRFATTFFTRFIPDSFGFFKNLIPTLFKPMLIDGIICFVIGILMVVGYCLINKKRVTETSLPVEEEKEESTESVVEKNIEVEPEKK